MFLNFWNTHSVKTSKSFVMLKQRVHTITTGFKRLVRFSVFCYSLIVCCSVLFCLMNAVNTNQCTFMLRYRLFECFILSLSVSVIKVPNLLVAVILSAFVLASKNGLPTMYFL
jgi:hypothetical protein